MMGKRCHEVSIPSRRVGDSPEVGLRVWERMGFHPLKAGRRPLHQQDIHFNPSVSIPSRRVGDLGMSMGLKLPSLCFHPLKAGRRLHEKLFRFYVVIGFPSPQGGSETIYNSF